MAFEDISWLVVAIIFIGAFVFVLILSKIVADRLAVLTFDDAERSVATTRGNVSPTPVNIITTTANQDMGPATTGSGLALGPVTGGSLSPELAATNSNTNSNINSNPAASANTVLGHHEEKLIQNQTGQRLVSNLDNTFGIFTNTGGFLASTVGVPVWEPGQCISHGGEKFSICTDGDCIDAYEVNGVVALTSIPSSNKSVKDNINTHPTAFTCVGNNISAVTGST